jgi:pyruvate-ferredoxin/flavodoxin oxidoreductase
MVDSTEERRDFWIMLRAIAGAESSAPAVDVEDRVRQEVIGRIASGLMRLAGDGNGAASAVELLASASGASAEESPPTSDDADSDFMAPWIDSEECTACDECVNLNSKMFKYDDKRRAYIADPNAGTYKELVVAAERCTAGVIHPGLPRAQATPGIEKLIERARAFN